MLPHFIRFFAWRFNIHCVSCRLTFTFRFSTESISLIENINIKQQTFWYNERHSTKHNGYWICLVCNFIFNKLLSFIIEYWINAYNDRSHSRPMGIRWIRIGTNEIGVHEPFRRLRPNTCVESPTAQYSTHSQNSSDDRVANIFTNDDNTNSLTEITKVSRNVKLHKLVFQDNIVIKWVGDG